MIFDTLYNRTKASINKFITHPHFIFYCFILFLMTRLGLVLLVPVTMHSDAGWYYARAISIASGQGYSENGFPTAYWPVGYPGFLGVLFKIFGRAQIVGQLANIVLGIGSFFLVLSISRLLFRNEIIARISIALLTLYPNHAAYAPLLMTETFFTFLVLLGTYLFLRSTKWIYISSCGLVFGLAALTKPQVIFLPGALILLQFVLPECPISRVGRAFRAIILYAMITIAIIPWAARNTLAFGEFVLFSTNGGATLLTGNNPSARGDFTPNDPLVRKTGFSIADQVAADKRAKELAIQWIRANPDRFLALMPLKIWRLWAPDGEGEWLYQMGYPAYDKYRWLFRTIRIANQAYYAFLLIGFLFSFMHLSKLKASSNWPYSLFPYLFAAYISAVSIVFSGQSRFHFPVMPWIMIIVAWLIYSRFSLLHFSKGNSSIQHARKDR